MKVNNFKKINEMKTNKKKNWYLSKTQFKILQDSFASYKIYSQDY